MSLVPSPERLLFASVGGDGSARIWTGKGRPLHYIGPAVPLHDWPDWLGLTRSDADGTAAAAAAAAAAAVGRGDAAASDDPIPFHIRCPPLEVRPPWDRLLMQSLTTGQEPTGQCSSGFTMVCQ